MAKFPLYYIFTVKCIGNKYQVRMTKDLRFRRHARYEEKLLTATVKKAIGRQAALEEKNTQINELIWLGLDVIDKQGVSF